MFFNLFDILLSLLLPSSKQFTREVLTTQPVSSESRPHSRGPLALLFGGQATCSASSGTAAYILLLYSELYLSKCPASELKKTPVLDVEVLLKIQLRQRLTPLHKQPYTKFSMGRGKSGKEIATSVCTNIMTFNSAVYFTSGSKM